MNQHIREILYLKLPEKIMWGEWESATMLVRKLRDFKLSKEDEEEVTRVLKNLEKSLTERYSNLNIFYEVE